MGARGNRRAFFCDLQQALNFGADDEWLM